jgi:hypothetical protein
MDDKFRHIDVMGTLDKVADHQGWYWKASTGILTIQHPTIEIKSPWTYINPPERGWCGIWHDIMFDYFNIIPAFCMECWKVVVVPRTVVELYKLHALMLELGLNGKCGIEDRPIVERNYGAYFYNHSLDQAVDCWHVVRNEVSKRIHEDIHVIIKRGCTEFERKKGPSDQWEMPFDQASHEKKILQHVQEPSKIVKQPDDLVTHIKETWIRFAASRSDMTYLELTEGRRLYPEPVTYHPPPLTPVAEENS